MVTAAERLALRRPDGTRPLVVATPLRFGELIPRQRLDVDLVCYTLRIAELNADPVPVSCLRTIPAGTHHLQHNITGPAGEPTDLPPVYVCAPCAVRDYAAWGVRERTETDR